MVHLTTGQLATALGLSASTVCRLANEGMPHVLTPGGKKRWSLTRARRWLADRAEECELEADEDDEEEDETSDDDDDSSDETSDDEPCEDCDDADCAGDCTDEDDEDDEDAEDEPDDEDE